MKCLAAAVAVERVAGRRSIRVVILVDLPDPSHISFTLLASEAEYTSKTRPTSLKRRADPAGYSVIYDAAKWRREYAWFPRSSTEVSELM